MRFKVREEVLRIEKYVAGKPISEVKRELGLEKVVKLASNENPLGCSPKVKEALRNLVEETFLYPDANNFELKKSLAKCLGVNESQIFCGAGSDSLIKVLCSTLINPGDENIIGEITFPRYETNIELMGGNVIKVPMKDMKLDLEGMVNKVTSKTKTIWFCNPNNPTGSSFGINDIRKLLNKIPRSVYIIMDEAYVEYVSRDDYPNSLELLKEYENIIILRTFSKAYGLASLRVGYGVAREELVDYFNRVVNSFDVNLYAQVAAVEALKDREFLDTVKKFNKKQRDYLEQEFDNMGLKYVKSDANFIMVNVKCDDKNFFNYLLQNGYIIRPGYLLGCPEWMRISIGKEEENRELISLMKNYLE
ncbi:histidinol-phosphate transaminase [Clostridium perfringens]|nr:histidinol-phosphate transaminase [Clostridium perfringens]